MLPAGQVSKYVIILYEANQEKKKTGVALNTSQAMDKEQVVYRS